jgi:hypothetical protein
MGDGRVTDSDPKEHKNTSYLICLYLIEKCSFVLLLSFRSSWQWEGGSKVSVDLLSFPGLRDLELKHLCGRKYLRALCVYFWATTPVVMSIFTFVTYVLLGNKLTAATVCGLTFSIWPFKR